MKPLKKFEKNITSQFGEDGVIEEIFNRIGTTNKQVVEFGAWDGKHLSNCWDLWNNKGWNALLIEGEEDRVNTLKNSTEKQDNIKIVQRFVESSGVNSLDQILPDNDIPADLDLLSIDIDGDDYYVFKELKNFQPRLLVIEFNPTIPPHLDLVQKKGEYFGASCKALISLGNEKGYKLAHITDTNLFFVTNSEFSKLGFEELNILTAFPYENLTSIITSFDGNAFMSKELAFRNYLPTVNDSLGKKRLIKRFLGMDKNEAKIPKLNSYESLISISIFKN